MPITGKTWGLPGLKKFSGRIHPKETDAPPTGTPSSPRASASETPLTGNPRAKGHSETTPRPRSRGLSLEGSTQPKASTATAEATSSAEVSKAHGVAVVKKTSLDKAARTEADLEKMGAYHLQLAHRADARVRAELYNPDISLMSDNKADWSNGVKQERDRANAASKIVEAIRTSGVNRLTHPQDYSKLIWEHKNDKAKNAHNCDELCHAAEDCIAEEDPTANLNRLQFKYIHPEYGQYGHSVTVIGALTPEILATPMKDWPPDLVICDVWGDIPSCLAKDYAKKFMTTMMDWQEKEIGVRIRPDRWEDADDVDWLDVVNHVDAALERSLPGEGPLQYKVMLPKAPAPEQAAE